jgi:hypothetical protein
MNAQEDKDSPRKLLLEDYFSGRTRAWGLFEDRFGNVRREFSIDIDGERDGERLTLTEDFTYTDGERETRIWTFDKVGADGYVASAEGVVGVATGTTNGNALRWEYDFDLPVGDRTWRVRFDDRMFLLDDDVLLNRSTVMRWGIMIGTVLISYSKSTPDAVRDATGNVSHADFGARRVAATENESQPLRTSRRVSRR